MKVQLVMAACFALLLAVPAMGQEGGGNRLDDSEHGPGGNSTAAPENTTTAPSMAPAPVTLPAGSEAAGEHVFVMLTDNVLYGFTRDELRAKRLGQDFSVYIAPLNGSIQYRILVDELPLTLSNGLKVAEADAFVEEPFSLPNLRRIQLQVEITTPEGDVFLLDYGLVRLRPMSSLALEVDDGLEEKIRQQMRHFTPAEWTWHNIWWGLVGLVSIGLGFFAGVQRGTEEQENARPFTIAG